MYKYKDKKYVNIEDAAKDLKINIKRLKKYLKEYDENLEKAVEAYNVENAIYVLNGVPFTSKVKLAKELGISSVTLDKIIEESNGSIEKAVEKIQNKKTYTYKNKEYTTLVKLSEVTGINRKTLTRIIGNETKVDKIVKDYFASKTSSKKTNLKDTNEKNKKKFKEIKKINVDVMEESSKNCNKDYKENEEAKITKEVTKEKRQNIIAKSEKNNHSKEEVLEEKEIKESLKFIYEDNVFKTIDELSKYVNINSKVLSRYIRKSNFNINRAIFMIKIKDTVSRKIEIKNTKLTAQDLAIVLGMKYDEVVIYLEQGKNIEEIDSIGRKNNINSKLYVNRSSFEDNIVLLQYALDNGFDFNYFYTAINNYGKSKAEVIKSLSENECKIPRSWILEKYGILLKYLMKSKNIPYLKILKEMRKNNISFEYALENYILRKKAKEYKINYEFVRIFFSLLTLNGITDIEKENYINKYGINEQELKCIDDSKTKLDSINRIIFLYEFAENIFKNGLSEEKIKNIIDIYNITNDEIELLFLELNPKYNIDILSSEDDRKEKLNKYARIWYLLTDKEKIDIGKKFLTPTEILQVTRMSNEISKYVKRETEKVNKDTEYINLAKKAADNYVENNLETRNILENNEMDILSKENFVEIDIQEEKEALEESCIESEEILGEKNELEELNVEEYDEESEESLFEIFDKIKKKRENEINFDIDDVFKENIEKKNTISDFIEEIVENIEEDDMDKNNEEYISENNIEEDINKENNSSSNYNEENIEIQKDIISDNNEDNESKK